MKTTIRIGGVPEHFNYPWHYAIERGWFEEQGIKIEWYEYSNGTGAMCTDLKSNKLDLAIVLTEGIVADISKGSDLVIIEPYVQSPLLWGIHVPYASGINTEDAIYGRTYAISRYGSGSHLMAYVDAMLRGWKTDQLDFKIVENMEGARKSFKANEAQVFFWEKFTTKPLVDAKEFRLAGIRPTPWPCFVLAGRKDFSTAHVEIINKMSEIISRAIGEIKATPEDSIAAISNRYKLKQEDVKEWFSLTQWATQKHINKSILDKISDILFSLKLIEQKLPAEKMLLP